MPKTVAASGGFDPLHVGHIRYLREAKQLGDLLVVILNNDNWLQKKKGWVFMNEEERKEILLALEFVDAVIVSSHAINTDDESICDELAELRPDIFVNGGDRKADNIPEYQFCKDSGIELVFNVGGKKLRSSSELVQRAKELTKQ